MLVGPTRRTRAQARQLLCEILREMGTFPLQERLMGWATLPLATWTWLTFKLNIFQQPGLLRIEHRVSPVQRRWKAKSSVMRLQGGFHADPLRVLAEDLSRNVSDLLTGVFPPSSASSEELSTSAAEQIMNGPQLWLLASPGLLEKEGLAWCDKCYPTDDCF